MGRYIDDTRPLTRNPTLFHAFLYNTFTQDRLHGIYPPFFFPKYQGYIFA